MPGPVPAAGGSEGSQGAVDGGILTAGRYRKGKGKRVVDLGSQDFRPLGYRKPKVHQVGETGEAKTLASVSLRGPEIAPCGDSEPQGCGRDRVRTVAGGDCPLR